MKLNTRITAQHWHYALVAVLCLLNLALGVRLAIAWRSAEAGTAARLQERQAEYRTMQLKTRPLRGLDKKIVQARADEQAFYEKRFPDSYSEVEKELGKLAVENNVLLNRVQYGQGKPNEGVTRVLIDASLSGDYAPVVRFINGLERARVFFIIDGIVLNGEQNGIVSLRMKLITYLRGGAANGQANAETPATGTKPEVRTRPIAAHHGTRRNSSATERR